MSRKTRFSSEDARLYYDWFGKRQDSQGFYEDAALDAMIRHSGFSEAQSVLEVGCGTGRLARRLLSDHLPGSARYVGLDISRTMVDLARARLEPWSARAEIHLGDGGFDFAHFGNSFDWVVFTYVFDLLGEEDIANALAGAHAVMRKGALLCACGLTRGSGVLSRATSATWAWVHGMKPSLVGGCRPLVLSGLLPRSDWRIAHREVVVSMTVPSELLVAEAA